MADHTINVDIIDRSVPIGNHVNIAVVNKPNPVYNEAVNASELWYLINIPNYFITDASTGKPINGTNYYDYFPEEGEGGGGTVTIDTQVMPNSPNPVQNQAIYSFVNSSVATNTANFVGTYDSLVDLEEHSDYPYDITNNDYGFVVGSDSSGNTEYERYKYNSESTDWQFEYTLNNSSFTAAEWATIQSGLTAADKTKYDGYEAIINSKPGLIESSGGEIFNTYTGSSKNSAYDRAHAEGLGTSASGLASHSEGVGTEASGDQSHAEGKNTTASGFVSHTEGENTKATNDYSHAEGYNTTASGRCSHAEGVGTKATNTFSHAEGGGTTASGEYSHVEGGGTTASGKFSHAEGGGTTASGENSHAEGAGTTASSYCSHAEGYGASASGYCSHAEGSGTSASNYYSHAEGVNTTASNGSSHAEGSNTTASGMQAHAEGNTTTAYGAQSHAEGAMTKAMGHYSHAEGLYTTAQGKSQHVEGEYNVLDTDGTSSTRGKFAHIIGNGTADDARSNALAVDWDGKIYQPSDPNADPNGVYLSSKADLSMFTAISESDYEALVTKDRPLYFIYED